MHLDVIVNGWFVNAKPFFNLYFNIALSRETITSAFVIYIFDSLQLI